MTSVPISHATPACAYAHNVHRDDYQDLTRDLVGLPSIAHPRQPLPGVDVLIGGGFSDEREKDDEKMQGRNFVPGNAWITADDLQKIDAANHGKYVVAIRTPGVNGRDRLAEQALPGGRDGPAAGRFSMARSKDTCRFRTADGSLQPHCRQYVES